MTAMLRQATMADAASMWIVRHSVTENTLAPGRLSDEDLRREIEVGSLASRAACSPALAHNGPHHTSFRLLRAARMEARQHLVGLTRFGGPLKVTEGGVKHGEIPAEVHAGVSASDG